MKPNNWNKMTDSAKRKYAFQLLNSMRGQYLLSQALFWAIKGMKQVKAPHTELSNIEDMEVLRECVLPIFTELTADDLALKNFAKRGAK